MDVELLTFQCRELIKFPYIYMTYFQNESIYIQKTHLLCDACIVDNSKTSKCMRFLNYAFFLAVSHVSVPFSWPFFWQN